MIPDDIQQQQKHPNQRKAEDVIQQALRFLNECGVEIENIARALRFKSQELEAFLNKQRLKEQTSQQLQRTRLAPPGPAGLDVRQVMSHSYGDHSDYSDVAEPDDDHEE